MNVNRKELIAAISDAARANGKSTIPILCNVRLEAKDGELTVTGTDLEVAVIARMEADGVAVAQAVTAAPKGMLTYLKSIKAPEVTLALETEKVVIGANGNSAEFAGLPAESYPELPAAPADSVEWPGLGAMLSRVIHAVSTEDGAFTLTGILLEAADGEIRTLATDGHRIARADGKAAPGTRPFSALLRAKAAREVARLGGEWTVGWDENHLFLVSRSRTVIARKLEGNFPDWRRVWPKDGAFTVMVVVNRKAALECIKRVLGFADERTRAVMLESVPGGLKIAAKRAEECEYTEVLPAAVTGEVPRTRMNGRYLAEALSVEDEADAVIEWQAPGECPKPIRVDRREMIAGMRETG